MSKKDDVNHLRRLAFRHQETQDSPANRSAFQLCLAILFKHFVAGLGMSAAVFIWSFFYTGDRADYLRWMSLAPMTGVMLGGLVQVIRVFDGAKNRDRKNPNV